MSHLPGKAMNGRRARHILDRCRNPEYVTPHAVDRLLEDFPITKFKPEPITREDGRQWIRALCRKAKKIRKKPNIFILLADNWMIFIRDRTVVTVMHEFSPRRNFNFRTPSKKEKCNVNTHKTNQ